MKKRFRKVVLLIMVAAISTNFSSCIKNLNQSNASEVAILLREKYGEEFIVHSIGDRLASDGANVLTAYCSSKSKSNVIFEARMNSEKELVYDNYPIKILCDQARGLINNNLDKTKNNYYTTVSISKLIRDVDPSNADISKVIIENNGLLLTFDIYICECIEADSLYDEILSTFQYFYNLDKTISIGAKVWNLKGEHFTQCTNELSVAPDISETVLYKMNPIGNVNFALIDGEPSIEKINFTNAVMGIS